MNLARLVFLTLTAMIAFASNSLLCRAALRDTNIDAATFTFIRIFAGAIALSLILKMRARLMAGRVLPSPRSSPKGRGPFNLREKVEMRDAGDWISALALFVYAAAFSFAYNTLSAGTGALLLFGAVQATMILWALRKGEQLDSFQTVGLVAALIGLVVLGFPGLSAPSLIGSVLMLGAGVAWGIYSLRGRGVGNPIATTAGNFLRAVPFAALISVLVIRQMRPDSLGMIYAIVSGAITSGLGYVIWYAALSGLNATSAAAVQLSVPVITTTGGILLLSEPITLRYIIASVAVLGGIFLVIIKRRSAALSAPRDATD
ncbi:MAG TPA: DMT family transporter [Chthoniobacterales bacterium]|nr:DMT family transporter [Chthoniobacterales bacterium]